MTATLGTVLFGVLVGVGVAIALSLVEILYRLARPHEGVLGRVPGLAGMHDVDDYPDAQTLPGLVVYRYDAPLFFANVGDMRRRALLAIDQENAAVPEHPVRWFILNVEANLEVDITAADGLRQLHADLATRSPSGAGGVKSTCASARPGWPTCTRPSPETPSAPSTDTEPEH